MFQAFRVLSGFLLCFGLLGCGYAAHVERAKTEIECEQLYPNETQVIPRANCIQDARMKAARVEAEHGHRHLDPEELLRFPRKDDRGSVTPSERSGRDGVIVGTDEAQQ